MVVALWLLDCQDATKDFVSIIRMMHFLMHKTPLSFFGKMPTLHAEHSMNELHLKKVT
jgi:hypothetical protein